MKAENEAEKGRAMWSFRKKKSAKIEVTYPWKVSSGQSSVETCIPSAAIISFPSNSMRTVCSCYHALFEEGALT